MLTSTRVFLRASAGRVLVVQFSPAIELSLRFR